MSKIAKFVYFCIPISARIHAIQKYTKFAKFARLYFPHFTTFRNQTLQFYSFQHALFGNILFFAKIKNQSNESIMGIIIYLKNSWFLIG